MLTSSAKSKGRRLQQFVRDALRSLGASRGLVAEDIESRGMGQNGCDLILSPAAQRVFDLAIECKACESLNVHKEFWEHYGKYSTKSSLKLLIHNKNRCEPLVTIKFVDFIGLLEKGLVKTTSESKVKETT